MVDSDRVIGVVGMGSMGSGVAQLAAVGGFEVRAMDVGTDVVSRAFAEIHRELDDLTKDGRLSKTDRDGIASRLQTAQSLDDLASAECVVEAVPEDKALKRRVLAELDQKCAAGTLLATTTSGLSVTELAGGLRYPDRVVGLHFYQPVSCVELVELVQGAKTSEQAIVSARSVCAGLKRTPAPVKDSPGFVGNRVSRAFYLEAMRLLESGEAGLGSIDRAVREVGGFEQGPFERLDSGSLDAELRLTQAIYEGLGKPDRFAPSPAHQKLVAAGHLGRSSGRGFYNYTNGEPTPAYEVRLQDRSSWRATPGLTAFAKNLGKPVDRATWLYARIMAATINEAATVADSIAKPRDVNLTMEMAFGHPSGPLAFADCVGLDVVLRLLEDFAAEAGKDDRFEPSPLLARLVADGHLGEKTARGFLHHSL